MAEPYTISVPNSSVEDLKTRLSLARFPDELDDAGWDYGSPLAEVKRLTAYWKDQFKWRKVESELNKLPQFHTTITVPGFSPIDLHFLHQRSSDPDSIPLLFCHGWPGSYLEATKLLEPLTNSTASPSFHLVAPSLPNYAWSSGIKTRGFGLSQYATACHLLMQSLGYTRYVTQGGDWGFYITRTMSLLYPESCLATHINMIRAFPPSLSTHPLLALSHATTPYTEFEKRGLERSDWFANEGSGYKVLQCTKPQTPGYGVTDSPVGLLAWILEKLHDWTDAYPWTDEEVCTWVSVYWFGRAGPAASFRIYYEATHDSVGAGEGGKDGGLPFTKRERTQEWIGGGVKVGLCYAPKELSIVPRAWAGTLGEMVFVGQHESGGHFLAHERPEAIAGDLREMFGRGGPCKEVVRRVLEK
ncbi:epoxide hydrolase-like protein 2 [Elsinoe australis]|uniref:Epoxide hydrolase-like protein 2 n=1 Tax=Elsinoe australis TaxID=40998 RepID=A0A4U7B0S4_9PEZI|nr:epoxide hydrolase-like protein 2 [Elsinoe australis]